MTRVLPRLEDDLRSIVTVPGEIALAPILLAENPYAAYLSAVEAIAASATSTS